MPPKTRKQTKRSAGGNPACSTRSKRVRTRQEQADRKKATEENKTYLQSMLTSVLSQNAMANYSQSGHEFVDVAMQDSLGELEHSFNNSSGIPRTSSAFSSIITTAQRSAKNLAKNEHEEKAHSPINKKNHENEELSTDDEPEITLRQLPEDLADDNVRQIDNASEDVVDNVAPGAQSTCRQVSARDPQEGKRSASNSEFPVGSDSETEIEHSAGHNALLMKRCNKQSETLRKYKKKINAKDVEIAQLKDLVVHAVSEAKAAKEDPNAKQTFTPDENLNITTAEIEHINSLSKNVGAFAQNLAIHLYGADELCKRSVSGRNYKGASSGYETKPAISPTKLKFIYSTAKDRIALQVGDRNHEQISTLANKSLINRALAEKIANLNKARKLASLRNASAESSGQ